jgi:predicted transcriptional regulator
MDKGLVDLSVNLVGAYVQTNRINHEDLPALIARVHAVLSKLSSSEAEPAVERVISSSSTETIAHDYLISLEDGQRYRILTRHLKARGLTPDQYRSKWNLPYDYPMVAPSLAKARSEMAKARGLGRGRKTQEPESIVTEAAKSVAAHRKRSAKWPMLRSGRGKGRQGRAGRSA